MKGWRYRITIHSADEILARLTRPIEEIPPVIFCDTQGACYFDPGPNPLTQAIEEILNQAGEQNWELVQINFRPHQMICFWKQPVT